MARTMAGKSSRHISIIPAYSFSCKHTSAKTWARWRMRTRDVTHVVADHVVRLEHAVDLPEQVARLRRVLCSGTERLQRREGRWLLWDRRQSESRRHKPLRRATSAQPCTSGSSRWRLHVKVLISNHSMVSNDMSVNIRTRLDLILAHLLHERVRVDTNVGQRLRTRKQLQHEHKWNQLIVLQEQHSRRSSTCRSQPRCSTTRASGSRTRRTWKKMTSIISLWRHSLSTSEILTKRGSSRKGIDL